MVPKELHTIKRNQATVVCVVYKLLIMGDSVHTSGFAARTLGTAVAPLPPACGAGL